jgi:hypothetical protein
VTSNNPGGSDYEDEALAGVDDDDDDEDDDEEGDGDDLDIKSDELIVSRSLFSYQLFPALQVVSIFDVVVPP